MQRFARDHDRLLQASARALGLSSLGVSLLCICLPGVLPLDILLTVIPLYAFVSACLIGLGWSRSLLCVIPGMLAAIGILVLVQLPLGGGASSTVATSVVTLAGGAIPAFAIVLVGSVLRTVVLAAGLVSSVALTALAVPGGALLSVQCATVALGWVLAITFVYWLRASVTRASRRVFSIGRARRTERQASEIEAKRRQSARLLHDTVLATLTLMAHSGVGVSAVALREQAADDAHLLRQLRLGGSSAAEATENRAFATVQQSTLGHTLESVKQRFGRIGLAVSWHGTGQVLLPSHVLDEFLLALAECLENVRRHSGVSEAHVTITDDEKTVRAMVTDGGVGFTLADIDAARLGFKESVVARLKEVGGNARLFSSPGSGTTVVLEVPK